VVIRALELATSLRRASHITDDNIFPENSLPARFYALGPKIP